MKRGRRAKRRAPQGLKPKMGKPAHVLNNNIKSWRGRRLMTQAELAEAVGVTRTTVSYWENCVKAPTDLNKIALCKVLECRLSDLFDWRG